VTVVRKEDCGDRVSDGVRARDGTGRCETVKDGVRTQRLEPRAQSHLCPTPLHIGLESLVFTAAAGVSVWVRTEPPEMTTLQET